MQEGGDRGKGPNKTGTQPKRRATKSPTKRRRAFSQESAGLVDADGKHAAAKGSGRKGPRKVAQRTTSRSADKH